MDAAALADMPMSYWVQIEDGIIPTLTGPTLHAVANVLDCHPSRFAPDYEFPEQRTNRVYQRVRMLKDYLAENRINAHQFALAADVHPATIYKFNRRGGMACSATAAYKIARGMGAAPEEFCPALGLFDPEEAEAWTHNTGRIVPEDSVV